MPGRPKTACILDPAGCTSLSPAIPLESDSVFPLLSIPAAYPLRPLCPHFDTGHEYHQETAKLDTSILSSLSIKYTSTSTCLPRGVGYFLSRYYGILAMSQRMMAMTLPTISSRTWHREYPHREPLWYGFKTETAVCLVCSPFSANELPCNS